MLCTAPLPPLLNGVARADQGNEAVQHPSVHISHRPNTVLVFLVAAVRLVLMRFRSMESDLELEVLVRRARVAGRKLCSETSD